MIKLGIIVVYMVNPEDAKLLDLHLEYIEKYTDVPYTIYGSANRLLPQFRQQLEQHPRIKICDCPVTDLRGAAEHAYYLEHLTKYAVDDGVSHIVTMHVDSFPISLNWTQELLGRLDDKCVFVTLAGINTACLFFRRDFYLRYKPRFLIAEEVHQSKKYWQFQKTNDFVPQSGVGFAFKAYQEGLAWYCLTELRHRKRGTGIFDNKIFHLGSHFYLGEKNFRTSVNEKKIAHLADRMIAWAKLIIPRESREFLRAHFETPINCYIDSHRLQLAKALLKNRKEKLLADPEAYLNNLRTYQK